jgi:hypothetical protein
VATSTELYVSTLPDSFVSYSEWYCNRSKLTTWLEFYFNCKNAIFGKIKRETASNSSVVPYYHFIATPLLPCGEVDGKVIKYTGNDYIGEADDPMTQAVHAFAHFSLVYTSNYLLFCDLQGKYNLAFA